MTTIAGVCDGKRVWLGGDSAVTDHGAVYIQATPKVFIRGRIIIGICGSAEWEALLHDLSPREVYAVTDPEAYLRAELTKHIRGHGLASGDNLDHSEGIAGFAGRLWIFSTAGAIWEVATPWTAIGSGSDCARGVLHYTAKRKLSPSMRVRAALEAAAELNTYTRAPFHIVSV